MTAVAELADGGLKKTLSESPSRRYSPSGCLSFAFLATFCSNAAC